MTFIKWWNNIAYLLLFCKYGPSFPEIGLSGWNIGLHPVDTIAGHIGIFAHGRANPQCSRLCVSGLQFMPLNSGKQSSGIALFPSLSVQKVSRLLFLVLMVIMIGTIEEGWLLLKTESKRAWGS